MIEFIQFELMQDLCWSIYPANPKWVNNVNHTAHTAADEDEAPHTAADEDEAARTVVAAACCST